MPLLLLMMCLFGLMGCRAHTEILTETQPQKSIANKNQGHWWQAMHSPKLNQSIEQALKNNNQILSAKSNIVKAQALLKAAHNTWLPALGVNAGQFAVDGFDGKQTLPANLAPLNTGDIHAHGHYAGFVPDYSLNVLNNVSTVSAAKASLALQQGYYQSVRLNVISQTSGAYLTLLGLQQQYREQTALVKHLEALCHLEAIRHRDGAGDVLTIATTIQDIEQAKSSLLSVQSSMAQTENALNLLMNQNLGKASTDKTLNELPNIKGIKNNISAESLGKRPDLMIAKATLQQAIAEKNLAYSAFFPSISLTGMLGTISAEFSHLVGLSTGIGLAQLAASIPLFNGVAYQNIQAAKAGVDVAYYAYLQAVMAALVDVHDNMTQYQNLTAAVHNQTNALFAAKKAYQVHVVKHKVGAEDYRAVLQAAVVLDKAKISRTVAKLEQLNSLVMVNQALGRE